MQQPRLLLADEPTSSLDPKNSVETMALVKALSETHGFPVIVNIHNVALARRFANRIVGLTGGVVAFDGPPERLDDDILRSIYGGEDWLA
jgi:phosphonate transport system ATP-binding protein